MSVPANTAGLTCLSLFTFLGRSTSGLFWTLFVINQYSLSHNFPGCKLLTDDILRPILQRSPLLTSLDLSECHHLTAAILQTVSVRCPRLARLILSECHWVSRTALVYHSAHQGRQPGQGIQSALPRLERVGSDSTLKNTLDNAPLYQLREIDLTGCWELDDATVVQVFLIIWQICSTAGGA